jgi:hypothetical protein
MTEKIKIVNETYYRILIGLLSLLLIYNLYVFMKSINLIGVLPILFQSVLLYLLLTKNQYSQTVIKYWVGFICIILQLIKIGSTLLKAIIDNMQNEENPLDKLLSEYGLSSMALLIFGVIILILNNDFATKMKSQ